jgi:GNAT superfamily N-acetyltransferase
MMADDGASPLLLRPCDEGDFGPVLAVIEAASVAYRGVIPPDRYRQPYMSAEELRREIDAGVRFWGCFVGDELVGVMGVQDVRDVTLIRHAYVLPAWQRRGVGGRLLAHLVRLSRGPLLVGTWGDASWAVGFYEAHGFVLVHGGEKDRLLRRYWDIPERQVETSVVLVRRDPERRPQGDPQQEHAEPDEGHAVPEVE